MQPIPEYEILTEDGIKIASNGLSTVTLMDDGRMFKRNAIKKAGTPGAYKEQWIVAELNGVRVYVRQLDGMLGVIVTKEDLYP